MIRLIRCIECLAASAFLVFAFAAPLPAASIEEPAKPATAPADKKPDAKDTKQGATTTDTKPADPKPADAAPAPDKKSEQDFRDGYKRAYAAIYERNDYAGGIAMLRALGHDEHPDVANLIGFSSRKLGRTADAKDWYEKALAADPNHTRTWQYYGLWHLEQGNRLKAEEHLKTIAAICGSDCDDFKSLQRALVTDTGSY